jgi:uncharacterized protein YhfF
VLVTNDFPEARCELGVPGRMRDALVEAVISGAKTATSSLLAEWEHDGDVLPEAGQRSTVIDSLGAPAAIIEFTGIEVLRLGDVRLEVALAEGEGFHGIAEWRAAHERFWTVHCLPELPRELITSLNDETLVVVERFVVVDGSRACPE